MAVGWIDLVDSPRGRTPSSRQANPRASPPSPVWHTDKRHRVSVAFSTETWHLNEIHEKMSDKLTPTDILLKNRPILFKYIKVMKGEKVSQGEEIPGELATKFGVGS